MQQIYRRTPMSKCDFICSVLCKFATFFQNTFSLKGCLRSECISVESIVIRRIGRPDMFFKIGVLRNFAKFTRKHLCWSLLLMKLQACRTPSATDSEKNKNILNNFRHHISIINCTCSKLKSRKSSSD